MSVNLNIMVGAPGSGKSTYIAVNAGGEDVIISRDAIRYEMVAEDEPYFSKEKAVFKEYCDQINAAGADGVERTVWADATQLSPQSRKKLLNRLDLDLFDNIRFVILETDIKTCLQRNGQRSGRGHVPDDTLINMYNSISYPNAAEILSYGARPSLFSLIHVTK